MGDNGYIFFHCSKQCKNIRKKTELIAFCFTVPHQLPIGGRLFMHLIFIAATMRTFFDTDALGILVSKIASSMVECDVSFFNLINFEMIYFCVHFYFSLFIFQVSFIICFFHM